MIGCGQVRIALTRSPVMPGEIEQVRHRHLGQRLDDLEHVAAGAEIAARARQHDGAHVAGLGELAEQIAQFRIAFEGQRVFLLGPVQRDGRDASVGVGLEAKMLRLVILEGPLLVLHRILSSSPCHNFAAGDRDSLAVDRRRVCPRPATAPCRRLPPASPAALADWRGRDWRAPHRRCGRSCRRWCRSPRRAAACR